VRVTVSVAPALRLLDLPGPLSTHACRLVIPCFSLTRITPSSTREGQLMIIVSMTSSQRLSVVNLDIACLSWMLFPLRFQHSIVVPELESLEDLQVAREGATKKITPVQSSGDLDVHLNSTPACSHSTREALFFLASF
jgi:hypothetical protein